MSTTFCFRVTLTIGEEVIPLLSEVVVGADAASQGVQKGFLFQLDLKPGQAPPQVKLGDMVGFIESRLGAGAGSLAGNPAVKGLASIFPYTITTDAPLSSTNPALVDVRSFVVNSTTTSSRFSISLDIEGSDPSEGAIVLPAELSSWLKIENLAISFNSTSGS